MTLALLDTVRRGEWEWYHPNPHVKRRHYQSMCMAYLPGIAGVEPIKVLRLVKKLNDFMLAKQAEFQKAFINYLEAKSYYRSRWTWSGVTYRTRSTEELRESVKSDGGEHFNDLRVLPLVTDILANREEARWLKAQIEGRQAQSLYPQAASHWNRSDELARFYLLGRACDLAYYGQRIASQSFPATTSSQDEALVSVLVSLLEERRDRQRQAALEKQDMQKRLEINQEGAWRVKITPTTPPSQLTPRVLSRSDREALRENCLKVLCQGPGMGNVMKAITEFVEFCRLLSQPENHIYTAIGQYVQRQHNTRTFADMEGEMAWKLANLPRYTAYAKITKEQGGRQSVLKRKIQTLGLPPPAAGMDERRHAIINRSYLLYYRERRQIEEEIRQKEKRRLAASLEAPAPSETRRKRQSARAGANRQPREGLER